MIVKMLFSVKLAAEGVVDLFGVLWGDRVPIVVRAHPYQYCRAAYGEYVGEDGIRGPPVPLNAVKDQLDKVGANEEVQRRVDEGGDIVDQKIDLGGIPYLPQSKEIVLKIAAEGKLLLFLFFLFLFTCGALLGAYFFL